MQGFRVRRPSLRRTSSARGRLAIIGSPLATGKRVDDGSRIITILNDLEKPIDVRAYRRGTSEELAHTDFVVLGARHPVGRARIQGLWFGCRVQGVSIGCNVSDVGFGV